MEALSIIYMDGSQICHPKGKTYRDAQLRELIHSIMVEHASEPEVICEIEPAREKCRECETSTERQPPQATSYEAAISSWG
jgi:hypothetical protein